jgi:hypothetical protein
MHIFILEDLI